MRKSKIRKKSKKVARPKNNKPPKAPKSEYDKIKQGFKFLPNYKP